MGNLFFLLKREDMAGFSVRALLLMIVLLGGLLVGMMTAWNDSNLLGACQLAFAVVLPCSIAGLLAGEFPRGNEFAILRLTGTIFTRSGLLLVFLLFARKWDLLNHGFIYYILAFYAIGLLTDMVLSSLKTWQWEQPNRNSESQSSGLAAN